MLTGGIVIIVSFSLLLISVLTGIIVLLIAYFIKKSKKEDVEQEKPVAGKIKVPEGKNLIIGEVRGAEAFELLYDATHKNETDKREK